MLHPGSWQEVGEDTSFLEGTRLARMEVGLPLRVVEVDVDTTWSDPSVADSLRAWRDVDKAMFAGHTQIRADTGGIEHDLLAADERTLDHLAGHNR